MHSHIITIESQSKAYTLPHPPPRCFSEQNLIHDTSYVLEEWSCVARNHEVFAIEELEEFISTDFDEIITRPHSTNPHESSHSAVALPERHNTNSYAEPPRKRSRLDAEPTSESVRSYVPEVCVLTLAYLVVRTNAPKPYFYPYPFKQQFSPPDPTPFFAKAAITPIDPHTTSSLRELDTDPYARYAWIIPIRGTLPWRECSDAQLDEPRRSNVINHRHSAKIPWTRDSLSAFWTFLIAFREAGTAGPLSLSLYLAPSPHSQMLFTHTFEAHGQRHSDPQGAAESHGSGAARRMLDGLPSIDHIKIYHDAPYTRYIRNVLNAWAYHEGLSQLRPLSDEF